MSRYSYVLSDKKRRDRTGTPLPPGVNLFEEAEGNKKYFAARFPYQSVVCALMYLAVHIRPDLSYTGALLSRFNSRPTYGARYAALHTLGYLSVNQGIVFPNVTEGEP